jgi:protocatechuate 3,4-dioxygenase beta subunit
LHHPHPHGLAQDLARLQQRRAALRWLGAGTLVLLAGCGGGASDAAAATASDAAATGSCALIPSETSGPFPGDGTNRNDSGIANALAQTGIVRSDIVSSFGTSTTRAAGIPLTIELALVDTKNSCGSLAGYAVYLWHCDALGRYSMYSDDVEGENYLRGVQVSDANGIVRFTSIFPGCYDGRWPHIHFEVFASLEQATSGNNDVKTSQLALPAAASATVYGDARYAGSAANLAQTSLAQDMVFADGVALQLPTISGDNANGYAIALQVGLAS